MDITDLDLSVIYTREDGSYLANQGLFHIPPDWTELWEQVDAYAKAHPEVVFPEPVEPEQEPTPEEIIERYTQNIQQALDDFAKTRKYDGIMSACSYAESTDPIFAAEATYCIQLRDTTWRQAYTIMDEVLAGTRPLMTIEELIAELPVGSAEWPSIEQAGQEAEA